MMAPGHALSGAAVGYVACLPLTTDPVLPHVIAVLTAGWALWPDVDCRNSTVTASLGPASWLLHRVVAGLCRLAYVATATRRDSKTPRIHRGATHTWPGAIVMGLLVAAVCGLAPPYGTVAVLAVSGTWALRGLTVRGSRPPTGGNVAGRFLTRKFHHAASWLPLPGSLLTWRWPWVGRLVSGSGRLAFLGISTVAAVVLVGSAPTVLYTQWAALLGACATAGVLVHMLGDSVTESGICWLFPFTHPRTKRRWEPIRLPRWVAFKTGRAFEYLVWFACAAAIVLLAPGGWDPFDPPGSDATTR